MTTKASTKTRNGKKTTTVKNEFKKKLAQQAIGLQVQDLSIDRIVPDPMQPRKTFNEESLKQLSESIEKHGVLQPITVRKTGKDYTIVMGERRYRASKLASRKTIPCIVREYDSHAILEIQIIENLQRQDVAPTEEAEAIAYLSEKYPPAEIAKRLGRTENFVRQRIKLAGLIEGFKAFVRSGEMTISLGTGVALFEPGEQHMMLEAMGEDFNAHQINRMVNDQTYDLDRAPFDITNEKLINKVGACTTCPFNAANQGNLFGDDNMVCTKSACYETKKNKSFLNLIETSKKEEVLLIPEIRRYWADDESNQPIISLLEKNGMKVYLLDDVEMIEEPMEPTMETIRVKYQHYDYSDEELKAELEEEISNYQEALKTYNAARDIGFENGIVVDPKTYLYRKAFVKTVEDPTSEKETYSVPMANRKMADCTPEEQIVKIRERENRKKHLENNKQFEEVAQMVRETDYVDKKGTLSVDEMVAFSMSLYENNVDYIGRQKYFSSFLGGTSKMTDVETVAHFKENFKKDILYKLIRYMLTKQVHFGESNHMNNLTNISFYNALQGYCKTKIATIEKRYTAERNKREARLKARIDQLEKQVQELND